MAVLKIVWCLKSCVNRMLLTPLRILSFFEGYHGCAQKCLVFEIVCESYVTHSLIRILSFFKGYHGCAQNCLVFEIVCKSYVTHSLTYFVFLQRIPWLCSKVFGV